MRKKQECYASNYELAELFQKMQIPMYVIFATLWQEFGMCLFNHFVRSRSLDAWKCPEPMLLAEVCYIILDVFFLFFWMLVNNHAYYETLNSDVTS